MGEGMGRGGGEEMQAAALDRHLFSGQFYGTKGRGSLSPHPIWDGDGGGGALGVGTGDSYIMQINKEERKNENPILNIPIWSIFYLCVVIKMETFFLERENFFS